MELYYVGINMKQVGIQMLFNKKYIYSFIHYLYIWLSFMQFFIQQLYWYQTCGNEKHTVNWRLRFILNRILIDILTYKRCEY